MSYRDYLNSDHWKWLRNKKRRICIQKHGCLRCGVCGDSTPGYIDLHHMFYRGIYDVKTSDLRFLCRICHAVFHELEKQGKAVFREGGSHHYRFAKTKALILRARGLVKPRKRYPADLKQPLLTLREGVRDALGLGN